VQLIAQIVNAVINAYMVLILVYCVGSMFLQWRGARWYGWVGEVTAPLLGIFRALPLRSGNMDFSPMVAMLALQLIQRFIVGAAGGH
jgi:YggT family protein